MDWTLLWLALLLFVIPALIFLDIGRRLLGVTKRRRESKTIVEISLAANEFQQVQRMVALQLHLSRVSDRLASNQTNEWEAALTRVRRTTRPTPEIAQEPMQSSESRVPATAIRVNRQDTQQSRPN